MQDWIWFFKIKPFMKRIKYLSENRKITSFTFNDDLTGDVVIVIETYCSDSDVIKYSSVSVPIEQLESFIQEYKEVTEKVKFAGLHQC